MPAKKVTCEELQQQIDNIRKTMTLTNIVSREFREKSSRREACINSLVTLTENIDKLREKDELYQAREKKLDELKRRMKELDDEQVHVKKEDVKDFMELKRGVEKQHKELKKAKDVTEDINNAEAEICELQAEADELGKQIKKLQKVINLLEIVVETESENDEATTDSKESKEE